MATQKVRTFDSQKTILWVSPIILDTHLHKELLLNTLRQLEELGHDTSLIAMRSKYASRTESSSMHTISVPLRYAPVISPLIFASALFLFLPIYIIKSKPDFVIMDPDVSILSSIPSLLVSRFKKMRFVLDVRSTPVEAVGLRGFLTKFWFSASVLVAKKLFHGITIITPLMKKEVCDSFDINPDKVGVWTSGVSASLFDPKNCISQAKELRRRLGLSGNFVVFYHGVFTATRGLAETMKAVGILKRKYPRIVLFLLGRGPMLPAMKELMHADGLGDNVVIHDPVPHTEVPKFIRMCDVCIVPLPYHPYWRFQCPVKLLEYLAMEKVIIATDIPAHRSIISEGKCVIYVSSIKPTEIARSIEYAYNNKEKLEQWGECGRTVIIENYTLEKVARDLSGYLLSIDDRL